MKTIKIFLSIAGFALSVFCFGQLHPESPSDLLFYTSYYNLTSMRMEHYVNPYQARINYGDHFEATEMSKTFFVPVEYEMPVEEWMTKPFENSYYEEEMQLESWMLSPFENSYHEEELIVESWMTEPFESLEEIEGEVEIEEWMTNPF